MKKHAPTLLFAMLIAAVALLLSAWNGSTDWMALLVFLAFAHPGFRRWALKLVRGSRES